MIQIITSISKISLIFIFALYTFFSFVFLHPVFAKKRMYIFTGLHTSLIYLFLADGSLVIYSYYQDIRILFLFVCQCLFLVIALYFFDTLNNGISKELANNMCMLLSLGFIYLERLDIEKAIRQFIFAAISIIICIMAYLIIKHFPYIKDLYVLYAALGIILLLAVNVIGVSEYGAKLSLSFMGISIQPNEFVKILFVFFLASCLYEQRNIKTLIIASVGAIMHILVLIASKDLGGAAILFITYVLVIYVTMRNIIFLFGGVAIGGAGLLMAYKLFTHVQTRFIAWIDPLSVADNQGYQITRALFAMGTGGWFGQGLFYGIPNKIPVVSKDFIFAAIVNEMGAFLGICVILICLCNFLLIITTSIKLKDRFYKIIAFGLGCVYIIQVFLTIGGQIKFIPSTGVTLPFVSYGGSSLLASMLLFTCVLSAIKMDYIGARNERKERKSN